MIAIRFGSRGIATRPGSLAVAEHDQLGVLLVDLDDEMAVVGDVAQLHIRSAEQEAGVRLEVGDVDAAFAVVHELRVRRRECRPRDLRVGEHGRVSATDCGDEQDETTTHCPSIGATDPRINTAGALHASPETRASPSPSRSSWTAYNRGRCAWRSGS